jgi:hypothetical protein
LALASFAASTAALVLGYGGGKTGILILPLAISTGLALIGEARNSGWSPTLWFLAQAGLCALGRSGELWELISISWALAYWDLSAFRYRMRNAGRVDEPQLLFQRHLLYLFATMVVGLGLGIASVIVRIDGDFASALLLGIIVLAGLSQLLRHAQVPATQLGSFGSGQADRNS